MIDSYYSVNEKYFFNKIDAVLYANTNLLDINWHFNQTAYEKHDWAKEPPLSLDEYYKIRAQEIRDQFDYVILLASGGADSTNMLYSFLRNGIKIDEIIASVPLEGLKNYQFNNQDTSPTNTVSEITYVQIPFLKEVSKSLSNTKITIHDFFEDMINYKTDEWLYKSDEWIHPTSSARYKFDKLEHLVKLADSNKKIAFVYGIDKPILMLDRLSQFWIMFSDLAVNVQRPPFDRNYPNVHNVLFYWDSTTTNLITKQAHLAAKWILKPENKIAKSYLNDLRITRNKSFEFNRLRHSKYERAIVPCIYPSTYRPIFQAEKPINLFLTELDSWFYSLHKNTRTYEMIMSDTHLFYKNINSKYLNSAKNGFISYSNLYLLGHYEKFSNTRI